MQKFLLIIFLIILNFTININALVSFSNIDSNKGCFKECPVNPPDNLIIEHGIFRLSFNKKTKFADWVVYEVKLQNLNGKSKERKWEIDPLVPREYAIEPSDYVDSAKICQYDRGHQAPLANFSNTQEAFKTNFLSNITP